MAPIVQQHQLVDLGQKSLFVSAAAIAFNPTFWNIVARREYRTRFMTKAFGGNAQTACYALAATIFGLGLCRDFLYERALRHQPPHPLLENDAAKYVGYALIASGNILVITSTYALGITGTFLGDYFGILMDDMVTGFPFSVCDAPMYYGSTMSFLGTALLYGRPAGILLTAWVLTVYLVALQYENPFTAGIYAKREQERASKNKGESKKLK
ncbi:Phosphatidyl-N-methylethanolamine N-methyltransferase [Diaporthe australafricana]|uniref:Phosphatidyl-N-methylethanolamine N-methyltransferase n=1 Tax=Diaporthe australafricana TaxID=127596 RepID=A0ABR3VXB4_9PEZI